MAGKQKTQPQKAGKQNKIGTQNNAGKQNKAGKQNINKAPSNAPNPLAQRSKQPEVKMQSPAIQPKNSPKNGVKEISPKPVESTSRESVQPVRNGSAQQSEEHDLDWDKFRDMNTSEAWNGRPADPEPEPQPRSEPVQEDWEYPLAPPRLPNNLPRLQTTEARPTNRSHHTYNLTPHCSLYLTAPMNPIPAPSANKKRGRPALSDDGVDDGASAAKKQKVAMEARGKKRKIEVVDLSRGETRHSPRLRHHVQSTTVEMVDVSPTKPLKSIESYSLRLWKW
ncbi:MAG: hypothetical protein Q9174_005618 [Haloplaca sp. 1 TL-2023]